MPLSVFRKIAEERIKEAMERGEFDNLELKGKPVELKEDPFVPEELRIVFRILKNAGFLPKEIELRKEIENLAQYLDEEHQIAYDRIKKLKALIFHLNQLKDRFIKLEESEYYIKIAKKVSLYKYSSPTPKENPSKIDFSKLSHLLSVRTFYRKRP